jgi:hypothetical protein
MHGHLVLLAAFFVEYLMPAGPGGSLREARGRQDAKYDVEKMKDNSEPEEDRTAAKPCKRASSVNL